MLNDDEEHINYLRIVSKVVQNLGYRPVSNRSDEEDRETHRKRDDDDGDDDDNDNDDGDDER